MEGHRPAKWPDKEAMAEIYERLGRLTFAELRMLAKKSRYERDRWLQTIYGKYAARHAKTVYYQWMLCVRWEREKEQDDRREHRD